MSTRRTFAVPIRPWLGTLRSSSPDVGAVGAATRVVAISSPATPISPRSGIGSLQALRKEGYCGLGDVTVISDGAEILKRLPRAMPTPTIHIIDWFHIAMKVQPMQQIASYGSIPV